MGCKQVRVVACGLFPKQPLSFRLLLQALPQP